MWLKKKIDILIEIGIQYSQLHISDLQENRVKAFDIDSSILYEIYQYFMRHGPHNYNKEELFNLLKGIIVVEIDLREGHAFGYGSVSASIAVMFALAAVDEEYPDLALKWARTFGYTNSYLPYGGRSDNSFYRYIYKYTKDEDSKSFALDQIKANKAYERHIKEEEKARHLEAEKKKQEIALLQKNDVEDRKNGVREALIAKLNKMTSYEKLLVMAGDVRHTVKFYPTNMAYQVTQEDINKLDKDQYLNVSMMLNMHIKGSTPWGQFKKKYF
jgi:hypothetical protein